MKYLFIALLAALVFSCNLPEVPKNLPMYGFHDVDPATGDTIYHTIPDFSFLNQDSVAVTNATFAGKAYVADFFFTSCPTICPKVKQQMMRLYERYRNDDRLLLLSYTIDPKRDTVGKLRDFAGRMGVSSDKWHFVTGDKDKIYALADDYMSIATENPDAPGGFDHSGWLLLIDKDRHIRAYCNGTKAEEVTKFMDDIDWLLAH
ncbi:MAG: SCO family protein [Saprospiraceae bacterium]|nr:SCO family protein [Saprospiraceae bacterium]MDZ4702849.1 SCO family protein [Saprospiraceae bacterium]